MFSFLFACLFVCFVIYIYVLSMSSGLADVYQKCISDFESCFVLVF